MIDYKMLQYPLLQGDKVSILMEYFKASDTATAIIKVNNRDQIAAMLGTLISHCIQLNYFSNEDVLLITLKAIEDAQEAINGISDNQINQPLLLIQ